MKSDWKIWSHLHQGLILLFSFSIYIIRLLINRVFFSEAHELCIVKNKTGRWNRASVLQKKSDAYLVMYIDYGNIDDDVTIDRIRELTEEFFFPCLTIRCYIDGTLLFFDVWMKFSYMVNSL